jgi:hypothetical protein
MEAPPIISMRPFVHVVAARRTRPILLRPTFVRLQRRYRSLTSVPATVGAAAEFRAAS